MTNDNRILVTGASGLVGRYTALHLLKKGYKIRALCTSEKGKTEAENSWKADGYDISNADVEWIYGQLNDLFYLEECCQDIKAVFHCAALVSYFDKDADDLMKINVEGTSNLINTCLLQNIKDFIYVSSVAALGKEKNGGLINESTPFINNENVSVYGISKYNAENEVWRGAEEGLNVAVVNPSVIIGPGRPDRGSSQLFESVRKGLMFYTDGMAGFVDVRDVANILCLIWENNIRNKRFILNSENIFYKDLFRWIASDLSKNPPSFKAAKWMAALLWRFEKLKSIISGKKPFITKETSESAFMKVAYDNKLICDTLNYSFIPIRESVTYTAEKLQLMYSHFRS